MQATQAQNNRTTTVETPGKSDLDAILDNTVTYKPFMGDEDVRLTGRMILTYFARPTRQGHMPTAQQAAKFVMLCKARGLNPWEGDAFIVGYDSDSGPEFNLITAHQAFLKRAEVHPEYDGMESGVTVECKATGSINDIEGDLVPKGSLAIGGWARVHFKTRKIPTYKRLNLETFSTGRSRWKIDGPGMIVKCAEADALRSSFPTKLGGCYLREEFDAMAHEAKEPRQPVPMPKAIDEQPMPTHDDQAQPEPPQEVPAYVTEWQHKLDQDPNLEQFNAMVKELPQDREAEAVVWQMMLEHGKKYGIVWDRKAKVFVPAEALKAKQSKE